MNNAGVTSLEPFLEVDPASFDHVMNVNVKAVINVSQEVAKKMIENKLEGSIVNVSSIMGKIAAGKNHTSYCVSKGALDNLTKTMALELGPHNIR